MVLRGFFHHLSWAQIQLVFNERIRCKDLRLVDVQLPDRVKGDVLFELGTLRECDSPYLRRVHSAMLGVTSAEFGLRFSNSAVLDWLKAKGQRGMELPHVYFANGLDSFLAAVRKDFHVAKTRQAFNMIIDCIENSAADCVSSVIKENRLGEQLEIKIVDAASGALTGRTFPTVAIFRRVGAASAE